MAQGLDSHRPVLESDITCTVPEHYTGFQGSTVSDIKLECLAREQC